MRRYEYSDEIVNVDDGHKEDRPEGIRLNPFANGDGSGSDQSHIRINLFGAEGGEA